MAIIANLTPTPVPANTALGGVPMQLFHVKVTAAGGAGTYTINHGLSYTPTYAFAVAELAEGTTPTASNAVMANCIADFTSTVIAINLPANGVWDVFYG